MNWQKYFEMMIDWKKLPAYKTEPRIDSFIGFYLPDIVAAFFKDSIIGIIPEFPIRLGTVNTKYEDTNFANRSYKVDFYLLGDSGLNYFIEFKTDSDSRIEKQDNYLANSQKVGMKKIVQGIFKISEASSYKQKYGHLMKKLESLKIISSDYTFKGNDEIKIVYVQPNNYKKDQFCIDFNWISNWLESKKGNDLFEKNLADSLRLWAND